MTQPDSLRILTPRLLLRDFVAEDWPAVHAYVSDPEVVRYLMFPPQSEDGTRQYVARMMGYVLEQPRTRFYLAIVRQQEGDVIGNINLACSGGELGEAQQGSFSYQLRRNVWGRALPPRQCGRSCSLALKRSSCIGSATLPTRPTMRRCG